MGRGMGIYLFWFSGAPSRPENKVPGSKEDGKEGLSSEVLEPTLCFLAMARPPSFTPFPQLHRGRNPTEAFPFLPPPEASGSV